MKFSRTRAFINITIKATAVPVLKRVFFLFLCLIFDHVCVWENEYLHRPEEKIKCLGARVTDNCKLPDMGTWN